ncbi:hypothetical protein [Nocardia sp. CA-290969]|uniref:hypothetical protein n=1 Tax=Nocardia sp. CA-290969 TaxID=3239986 RepID=UPI003D8BBA59
MHQQKPSPGRKDAGALLVMWLICLPLAWFFGHLIKDIPIRAAVVVAAGLDWAGERGTTTITRSELVSEGGGRGGSHRTTYCFGDFTPAGQLPPRRDIRVHVEGPCEAGRVVPSRLVAGDPANWIDGTEQDQVYAGAGWVSAMFLGVFMGAFLLLVGGIPIVCAVLFPVMFLRNLYDRVRRNR